VPGLIDIAVPVICEGQHVATLFTGQVLSDAPSESNFVQIQKDTAGLTYIDRAKLADAYSRLPVVSQSDIQRTIEVLAVFAEYLATTWVRLSDVVRDQQRKHRESNLERKEFGHLVLEGNLADRPLVRELMTRIGFTRYPNCVMVLKFESESEHQRSATSFDLLFTRALHAIEELCEGLQNVCCTCLRSQGICIFFHHRESVGSSMLRHQLAAEIFSPAEAIPLEVISRSLDLSDQELIQRAKYASNGERFSRLWGGDASDYGNDHSRADIALCRMLAFWTGGDSGRMDRLFRQSGLMREKWDRRTGDETFGALTIKAIPNR
jgi:Sensory domain found in PocR